MSPSTFLSTFSSVATKYDNVYPTILSVSDESGKSSPSGGCVRSLWSPYCRHFLQLPYATPPSDQSMYSMYGRIFGFGAAAAAAAAAAAVGGDTSFTMFGGAASGVGGRGPADLCRPPSGLYRYHPYAVASLLARGTESRLLP